MNLLFLPIESAGPFGPQALTEATLALLDEICREANAHVVLCSTHKDIAEIAELNAFFSKTGNSHTRVVGVTPECYGNHRGHEVKQFLETFSEPVGRYAVVDQTGEYFGWQPCFRIAPNELNISVGYEVLRQLNPESKRLAEWEQQYGFGGLLSTYTLQDLH